MKNIFTLCALIICIPFFSQVSYTDVDPDQDLQSTTSDSYAVDFMYKMGKWVLLFS